MGHGTLQAEAFTTLLADAHVAGVVDVWSFPGSGHNPHFGRAQMEQWVPAGGIGYLWMRALDGRRRPVPGSTPDFLTELEQLVTPAADTSSVVMCSESVWWRCHRRLLADHLTLVRDITVVHLMHDRRHAAHVPTEGVRLPDGALIYDAGAVPLPSGG